MSVHLYRLVSHRSKAPLPVYVGSCLTFCVAQEIVFQLKSGAGALTKLSNSLPCKLIY